MLATREGGEAVVPPLVRRKRGRPRKVRVDSTLPKILVDLRPAPTQPAAVEVEDQSSRSTDSDSDDDDDSCTKSTSSGERMSAKRRRSQCEEDNDDRWQTSPPLPPPPSSSLAVSGVLALLLDEVRDMQRSVNTMGHSVAKLATNQDSLDSMHHSLKRQLDSLGTVTVGRSPPEPLTRAMPPFGHHHHYQTLPSLRDHITLSDGLSRTRFGSLFPFLSSYDLDSMPFVIDDLCKPIVLMRVIDPRLMFRPMPVMVYGNQAFCDLTQYHPHEIQGFMVMKIFLASQANIDMISRHMQSNRSVLGVGEILHMLSTIRAKDGTLYTVHMRNQPFFDSNGKEAWGLTVIDKAEPVAPADPSAALQPTVKVDDEGGRLSLHSPPNAEGWAESGGSSRAPSPPALPPPSPFSSFSVPVPVTWSQYYTY